MSKKENSPQQNNFHDKKSNQPEAAKNREPGFGDKKLDGPNRPST